MVTASVFAIKYDILYILWPCHWHFMYPSKYFYGHHWHFIWPSQSLLWPSTTSRFVAMMGLAIIDHHMAIAVCGRHCRYPIFWYFCCQDIQTTQMPYGEEIHTQYHTQFSSTVLSWHFSRLLPENKHRQTSSTNCSTVPLSSDLIDYRTPIQQHTSTQGNYNMVTTLQTLWNSLTFPWQYAALMPMLSGTQSMPVVLVLM